MTRENAEFGALLTLEELTQPMRDEAASAGFYHSPGWNKDYPRIQIITVLALLAGKKIDEECHAPPFRAGKSDGVSKGVAPLVAGGVS
jgi:hypothetical protein